MTKICLNVILLIALFLTISPAQHLWKIEPDKTDFFYVENDTSVFHLKELLSTTNFSRYFAPARLLAYYHAETEKEYIIDTLRLFVDTNSNQFNWDNYYNYQLIRGYLGDSGGISGMDTIIRFSGNEYYQAVAIGLLGKIGYTDYFDTLRELLIERREPRFLILDNFSYYVKLVPFHEECKNILSTVILDTSEGMANMDRAIVNLYSFDSLYAQQIIKLGFLFTNGIHRKLFFKYLCSFEPDSVSERSIYAILHEKNESTRSSYIPYYSDIISGKKPPAYLKPKFIKFCKDLYDNDTSIVLGYQIRLLLNDFIPIVSEPHTSITEMLDTLVSVKHQCASYNWLSDSTFVSELDTLLINARNYLNQGDSSNCYRQIQLFKQKVDEEYSDSLDGDTKSINREAWKFLHYDAEYILARITTPPTQFMLTVHTLGNGAVTIQPKLTLYDSATAVTLTATPQTGYHFVQWEGTLQSVDNPFVITLTGNTTLHAEFIKDK